MVRVTREKGDDHRYKKLQSKKKGKEISETDRRLKLDAQTKYMKE